MRTYYRAEVARLRAEGLDFAYQNYNEFADWLGRLAAIDPRRGVEIGTYRGGTAALTLALLPGVERLVSVDILDRCGELAESGWADRLGARLTLLQGDSRRLDTREAVAAALAGEPADFFFIDGEHDYANVAADFYLFAPLVRCGGLVGFHDVTACRLLGEAGTAGVEQFWAELCGREPDRCTMFAESFGIGVYRR